MVTLTSIEYAIYKNVYENAAVQIILWLAGRIATGSQIYDSVIQSLVIENT